MHVEKMFIAASVRKVGSLMGLPVCMAFTTDCCMFMGLHILIFFSLTALRFRFSQHGYYSKHFCREFHVSSEYNIPELFYDCRWTKSEYEGTPFTFEYEARNPQNTEARRYVTKLPFYVNIGRSMFTS
jgi:hypothetical protein